MLTDSDGDAKKLKTSSDSDTAGAETLQKIHAEAKLSSMQDMSPAGPAKAPAPSSKAATGPAPVTPPKASPARPKTPPKAGPPRLAGTPITDREFAVEDLKNLVTSLSALDACLMHFSSKVSTPEPTLEAETKASDHAETPMETEDQVDWGGDDEAAGPEESKWDELSGSLKKLDASSPEEIQRLSELLTSHKSNLEKMLEQQEAKEKEVSAAGEVLDYLMREDWDQATSAIEKLRPEQLEAMADYSGMTVLYHAVRSRRLPLVLQICEKCPSLANRTTLPQRQPGHWTPLMIFANLAGGPQADQDRDIGYLLCQHMSLDGLNVRGTTWATASHIAVARSNWSLVKSILYRINDLGGRAAVMHHTAMTNNNVSWLTCWASGSSCGVAARLATVFFWALSRH